MKACEAILSGNEAGRRIEEIKKEMEALTKIGKTAEKRLNTEKEPSPQMGMVPGVRGSERRTYCCPLMARSACSMRRLPLLTGRRFNFNREDGKGRIKSKVSYHVQIKLV